MDADLFVSRLIGPEDLPGRGGSRPSGPSGCVPSPTKPRRVGVPKISSWLVIAALPLSSFLTSLSAKLAEDAHKELRRLAARVFGRGGRQRLCWCWRTATPAPKWSWNRISLRTAIARCWAPISRATPGRIRYDRDHGRWVGSNDREHVGSHRPAKGDQVLTGTINPSSSASYEDEGIFMSYRRQDDAGFAGRIADRLMTSFGIQRVFIDVDSIELGVDFSSVIADYLGKCRAMVVVIGRRWLDVADTDGRPRLVNPDDYVRIEIERALARNIRVVPVLVDGAVMPRRDDLPTSMESLTRRNGIEMSHAGFSGCRAFDQGTETSGRRIDRPLAPKRAPGRSCGVIHSQ